MKRWKSRTLIPHELHLKKQKYGWLAGLLAFSAFILLFGIAAQITTFTQRPIHEKVGGAVTVTETFEKIWRNSGARAATTCTIRTRESGSVYTVSSITLRCFDYNRFVNHVAPGEPITLVVSSSKTLSGDLPVYALSSGGRSFLTVAETVKAHERNDERNRVLGRSCTVIGLVLLPVSLIIRSRIFR